MTGDIYTKMEPMRFPYLIEHRNFSYIFLWRWTKAQTTSLSCVFSFTGTWIAVLVLTGSWRMFYFWKNPKSLGHLKIKTTWMITKVSIHVVMKTHLCKRLYYIKLCALKNRSIWTRTKIWFFPPFLLFSRKRIGYERIGRNKCNHSNTLKISTWIFTRCKQNPRFHQWFKRKIFDASFLW